MGKRESCAAGGAGRRSGEPHYNGFLLFTSTAGSETPRLESAMPTHATSSRRSPTPLPPSGVAAILGPTNTGKTHFAVERLLAHRSGIIGVPLRLLAREIYDRITEEIGAATTALITGEEKRIPPNPRYFICTVESMPCSHAVDFIAVDEIQLAAHHARGHIFTDRILNARGRLETLLLGADTMATILRALVPGIAIHRRPRLSTLRFGGSRRLHQVADRSALIAFSAADVYAAAEAVKHFHGGAAVVMGALSPRARNAQVALYQAGDVHHIVATDAIGMGLNLDIEQVVFLATRKFDGRGFRQLRAAEMAQIAGRAGRFRRDGTFSLAASLPALDAHYIRAIESHSFPQVAAIYYRASQLDFSGLEALRHSLGKAAPHPFLRLQQRADDQQALDELAERAEIRALLHGEEDLRLLWDVCGVPDFRGRLGADHVSLLGRIFVHLQQRERRLPAAWMHNQIARINRPEGDIETLMGRIAAIRTWTYVAHRSDWVEDSRGWQELTRTIEDRLSDALHQALTARFVDRRASVLLRGARAHSLEVEVLEDDSVLAQGLPCGHLRALRFCPDAALEHNARQRVERALGPVIERRIEMLLDAPENALQIRPSGEIAWRGEIIGRMRRGLDILRPEATVAENPLLSGASRDRVRRRLQVAVRSFAAAVVEPLDREATRMLGPGGRGIVHRLRTTLACLSRHSLRALLASVDRRERGQLARLDIRLGREVIYVRSFLRPASMQQRTLLWAVAEGLAQVPPIPAGAPPSMPLEALHAGPPAPLLGYVRGGPLWVRADVYERVASRLRPPRARHNREVQTQVQSWLACSAELLPGFMAALAKPARSRQRPRRQPGKKRRRTPGDKPEASA